MIPQKGKEIDLWNKEKKQINNMVMGWNESGKRSKVSKRKLGNNSMQDFILQREDKRCFIELPSYPSQTKNEIMF